MYPCCFLYHDNDAYEEFARERERSRIDTVSSSNPFSIIWHSAEYAQIRRSLREIDIQRSPQCAQCTRHFLHNTFLSYLHKTYLTYLRTDQNAHALFEEVLSNYEPGVVWL